MSFSLRLSGPGPQPQEGSVSLTFLLESKLKFVSLINFLRFLVQTLQPKKIIWVKFTPKDVDLPEFYYFTLTFKLEAIES